MRCLVNETTKEAARLQSRLEKIWSGNANTENATLTMSEKITDYDLIVIISRNSAGDQGLIRLNSTLIPVELYSEGGTNWNIPSDKNANIIFTITDDKTIKINGMTATYFAIKEVYGIKF